MLIQKHLCRFTELRRITWKDDIGLSWKNISFSEEKFFPITLASADKKWKNRSYINLTEYNRSTISHQENCLRRWDVTRKAAEFDRYARVKLKHFFPISFERQTRPSMTNSALYVSVAHCVFVAKVFHFFHVPFFIRKKSTHWSHQNSQWGTLQHWATWMTHSASMRTHMCN